MEPGWVIYEQRFLTSLRQRIADELTAKHNELGNGTQIVRDDAAATGMNCARMIGAIAGLVTALNLVDRIEEEMSGKPSKGEKNAGNKAGRFQD